jgi:hypothetical protein
VYTLNYDLRSFSSFPFFYSFDEDFTEKYMRNLINLISFLFFFRSMLSSNIHVHFISFANCCRVPYMGKGTFSIIVNQTESKAKTPSTDAQFLIPGFPASKLRAEKMVLSSYGLKLSNGKGKVIKYTSLRRHIQGIRFQNDKTTVCG